HHAVEAVPGLREPGEERVDLRVVRDVAGEHKLAAELARHLGDALLEAVVLVRERKLGALAPRCLGDPVRDRAVGEQAGDENALAGEKGHVISPKMSGRLYLAAMRGALSTAVLPPSSPLCSGRV